MPVESACMQRKSMELIYSTISVLLFIFKNHKKEAVNIKELHVISTGQQTSETLVSIVAEIHRYIDFLHYVNRNGLTKKWYKQLKTFPPVGCQWKSSL